MTQKSPRYFAAALGIRPEESQSVLALISASFFFGLGLIFFQTASSAIFLTDFDISTLPYAYIANAGVSVVFGFLYAAIEKRTTFAQLLYITNLILAAVTFLFWLSLSTADSKIMVFMALIWFRILFIYGRLGIAELTSNAFDVRQAKRIFALVGVGTMLAFIMGGLSTSVLVGVIGTTNLILLAAVGFLVYVGVLRQTVANVHIPEEKVTDEPARISTMELLRDRFVLGILGAKILATMIGFLADYIFYAEAARYYAGEESLANFLGTFTGAMMLVMALVTVLIAGRFTERFGVKTALGTLPFSMATLATIASVYGLALQPDWNFFALVAAMAFTRQVMEKSLYYPASAILYQPLSPDKRKAVILMTEGWFNSVMLALSGMMLLIFGLLPTDSILPYVFLMVGLNLLFLWLNPQIYRQYTHKLAEAVETPFVAGIDLSEAIDPELLFAQLRSSRTVKVRFALEHLMATEDEPYLRDLLNKKSPNIRREALLRIEKYQYQPALPQVVSLANQRDEPDYLRGQAMITWLALQKDAPISLSALSTALRPYGLIGWLRYGDEAAQGQAMQSLEAMATALTVRERLSAIEVLKQTQAGDLSELVIKLISDPVPDVRRAAILMAGQRLTPQVITTLLTMLHESRYHLPIVKALSQGGDKVVTAIQEKFDTLGMGEQPFALTICGKIGTPRAIVFLKNQFLKNADLMPVETYSALLAALREAGYESSDEALITTRIEQETTLAYQIRKTEHLPELLQRALAADLKRAKQRIFLLLGFLYGAHQIRDVEKYFLMAGFSSTGNALEMLDVTLSHDLKKIIFPLLENQPSKKQTEPEVTLNDLTAHQQRLSRWTQICLDYLANPQEHPMSTLIDKVITLRSVNIFSEIPDAVLAEMAEFLTEKQVQAGETFIEKDSLGDQMYIITSGQVRVHDGATTFSTMQAGDIVGEMAVLDPAPRLANVTAVTDAQLLVLSQSVLYDLMLSQPQVIQSILRVLVQRFRSLEQQVSH